MKRKRLSAAGIALLAFAILLLLGSRTVLHPCEHEDGTVSACYWAGQMITGIAGVLCVQALALLLVRSASARCALAGSIIPVALLAMLTPGTLIRLCLMASMRCNSVMRPGVMVLSFILFIVAAADAALEGMRAEKERKERHES